MCPKIAAKQHAVDKLSEEPDMIKPNGLTGLCAMCVDRSLFGPRIPSVYFPSKLT